MGSFKKLDRFAIALTQAGSELGPDSPSMLLHIRKSDLEGHAQVYVNDTWWDFPVAPLLNGIFTMMPDIEEAPAPRNPLRPVR